MAGKAVQSIIGSGALSEGQGIRDYGYGKRCLNFGKAFLQEATGSLHAGSQILESQREETKWGSLEERGLGVRREECTARDMRVGNFLRPEGIEGSEEPDLPFGSYLYLLAAQFLPLV